MSPLTRLLSAFAALLAGLGLALGCSRPYSGPVSEHFDGQRFFNPGQPAKKSFLDFLKWRATADPAPWPERLENARADLPPERVHGAGLRVTIIGHATALIQTAGLNILTDPVWSDKAGPFNRFGPRRTRPPGLPLEKLPTIDFILVSHNHYDHLDLATLTALAALPQAREAVVLTPLGNAGLIRQAAPELTVREMDWGDHLASEGTRVHCVPSLHWSARGLLDRRKALWSSFVIETGHGSIYFCADSGYGDGGLFRQAAERFGGFRLALLPIGAYEPRWFMAEAHMNPEEAVRAMADLKARRAIALHFGVFQLSDEGVDAPARDLTTALKARGMTDEDFRAALPGEGWDVP